jgi:hypothetical protein
MISLETKTQPGDRVLKLAIMDGKKPMSSIGTVDPSLFKEDGNKLHIKMDPETCLWSFSYEKGKIPPALNGQFTGAKSAIKHAELYFAQRNVSVAEVIDVRA